MANTELQNIIRNSLIRNQPLPALKIPIMQFPPQKMCDILDLYPTKFVTFCNFFPGPGVQLVQGNALPCREFKKLCFRQNFDVLSPFCLAYFQSCAFFNFSQNFSMQQKTTLAQNCHVVAVLLSGRRSKHLNKTCKMYKLFSKRAAVGTK